MLAFGATVARAAEAPPTLADAAQDLLLGTIEKFVRHAEAFWRASDLKEPVVSAGLGDSGASVTEVPRANYGPTSYLVEVSEDGHSRQQVAAVPAAPNGASTTTFAGPVRARWPRLEITDSWDSVRPPRNAQVAKLQERAP